jgi:hypothetical protein
VQLRRNFIPASRRFDLEQDPAVNQVSLLPSGPDEDWHPAQGLHPLSLMAGQAIQFIHNFHPPGKIDPPTRARSRSDKIYPPRAASWAERAAGGHTPKPNLGGGLLRLQ